MSTCPICLDAPRDPVKAAPCGHVFCRTCIKTWMRQSVECPCCRQNVRRPPAERRFRPVPVIMLLLFGYLLIYSPLAPFLKTLAVTVGVAFKDSMLPVFNRITLPFHLLFNVLVIPFSGLKYVLDMCEDWMSHFSPLSIFKIVPSAVGWLGHNVQLSVRIGLSIVSSPFNWLKYFLDLCINFMSQFSVMSVLNFMSSAIRWFGHNIQLLVKVGLSIFSSPFKWLKYFLNICEYLMSQFSVMSVLNFMSSAIRWFGHNIQLSVKVGLSIFSSPFKWLKYFLNICEYFMSQFSVMSILNFMSSAIRWFGHNIQLSVKVGLSICSDPFIWLKYFLNICEYFMSQFSVMSVLNFMSSAIRWFGHNIQLSVKVGLSICSDPFKWLKYFFDICEYSLSQVSLAPLYNSIFVNVVKVGVAFTDSILPVLNFLTASLYHILSSYFCYPLLLIILKGTGNGNLRTLILTLSIIYAFVNVLTLFSLASLFNLLFDMTRIVWHLFSSSWIRIVHSVYEIITEVLALIQNSIILVFCAICIVIYSITTTLLSAVIT